MSEAPIIKFVDFHHPGERSVLVARIHRNMMLQSQGKWRPHKKRPRRMAGK